MHSVQKRRHFITNTRQVCFMLRARRRGTRAHMALGVKRNASSEEATAGEASTSARARSMGVAAAAPRARLAEAGLRAEPPPWRKASSADAAAAAKAAQWRTSAPNTGAGVDAGSATGSATAAAGEAAKKRDETRALGCGSSSAACASRFDRFPSGCSGRSSGRDAADAPQAMGCGLAGDGSSDTGLRALPVSALPGGASA